MVQNMTKERLILFTTFVVSSLNMFVVTAAPTEMEILNSFYEATLGDRWKRNRGWWASVMVPIESDPTILVEDGEPQMEMSYDYNTPVCDRFGITCNGLGRVARIDLPNNNLKGFVPELVFRLSFLHTLNLADNRIDLDLGGLRFAQRMEYLYLRATSVSSLKGVGASAGELVSFHMSDTNLRGGVLPDELFSRSFQNLQQLFLSNCNLAGTVPNRLHLLPKLEEIDLSGNSLWGPLPSKMPLNSRLISLDLSDNAFTGTIPPVMGDLELIETLHLGNQHFGLTGTLPSFERATSITNLLLPNNSLSGTIPTNMLRIIGTQRTVYLDLAFNKLEGVVPSELASIDSLEIFVIGNRITGLAPELCTKKKWMSGEVNTYGCDAILCPPGSANPMGRRVSNGESCRPCDIYHAAIYMGSVQCDDRYTAERTILERFFYATGGPEWTYSTGWSFKEGENLSFCGWYGVECNRAGFVSSLILPKNNLFGTIPSDIYHLPSLYQIQIKRNEGLDIDFNGMHVSQNLRHIYAEEIGISDPESLRRIGEVSQLQTLHLRGSVNMRGDSIPLELTQLINLISLDLSQCNFGGKIPDEIGQWTEILRLDLYSNNLEGTIPTTIGKLSKLQELILSNNRLGGTLPSEMRQLTFLQSLYLERQSFGPGELKDRLLDSSGKGFSGPLPDFAEQSILSTLFLSSNNFTGSIPENFLHESQLLRMPLSIHLSYNRLTGTIPSNLARFDRLSLFTIENELNGISEDLCKKSKWMNGLMGSLGCDSIMCPINTYNENGRAMSQQEPCRPCEAFTTTSELWGQTQCTAMEVDDIRSIERNYLLELYNATDGDNWDQNTNWLHSDVDVCYWHGIYCDNMVFVSSIRLSNNQLMGTVPPGLFYSFANLQEVDLSMNYLPFISFSNMEVSRKLNLLNLYSTGISNVQGIDKGLNLAQLHLEKNPSFTGSTFPTELLKLKNLRHLYFSESGLAGSIPSNINLMQSLEGLYLYGNNLSGTLPEELGLLRNLGWLSLAENNFSGSIPRSLTNMKDLLALSLNDQVSLGGRGLTGTLPDFSSCLNLTVIFLASNSLTGTLPPTLLNYSDPSKLYSIDLSSNRLTGTVPAALSRFARLSLLVTDNDIESIDPSLCEKEDWMSGDVAEFSCDAILCPAGTYNFEGRKSLKSGYPCIQCNSTYRSQYLGRTKCDLEPLSERTILSQFYVDTGGPRWKRNTGWLDDEEDHCNWYGISCDAAGSVISINLGSNYVTGTPSPHLFTLPNLQHLLLYSNPIQFDFNGIGRANRLTTISLDSTDISRLDGIGSARNLIDFSVRFNRLGGSFPNELFRLRRLESLILSDNEFSSTLPPYFGNFSSLNKLLMGSNKFSGPLPEFRNLPRLRHLDLSNNKLTGTIPPKLIEDIDDPADNIYLELSSNFLTGIIPGSLSKFDRLQLHVKSNRFVNIDPRLCEKKLWNYDDVGKYGCDGLSCSVGTYNEIGRQTDVSTPCIFCPHSSVSYLGSTECLSITRSTTQGSVSAIAYGTMFTIVAALSGCVFGCFVLKNHRNKIDGGMPDFGSTGGSVKSLQRF